MALWFFQSTPFHQLPIDLGQDKDIDPIICGEGQAIGEEDGVFVPIELQDIYQIAESFIFGPFVPPESELVLNAEYQIVGTGSGVLLINVFKGGLPHYYRVQASDFEISRLSLYLDSNEVVDSVRIALESAPVGSLLQFQGRMNKGYPLPKTSFQGGSS